MVRTPVMLACLLAAATPAAADVTSREVWDDWIEALSESDAEIATGSVSETAGRLVVEGFSMQAGTEEAGYSLEVDRIALTANPDGTVGVEVSPEYPIVLTGTDEDGAKRRTELLVRHPGFGMTVAEADAGRRHAFEAPEIAVVLEQATVDGEPIDLTGEVVLEQPSGSYETRDGTDASSALSAAAMRMAFQGQEIDGDGTFDLTVEARDIVSQNMLQVMGADLAGTARSLGEGEERRGRLATAATTYALLSESEGNQIRIGGASEAGETMVAVSPEGLRYAGRSEDLTITLSGNTIPLPQFQFAVGRAMSGLAVPLLGMDEPQPYALRLSLLDVALDEGLWNMVDPAGLLPREDGAVAVSLSGQMTSEADFGAAGASDVTTDLETLSIDSIRLSLAGAEVDARGLLELMPGPEEGERVPVGEIDVVLTGVLELLDRLATIGLLPQNQAIGTRMMLNMFTIPGDGADELTSTVRLTPDGGVLLNEQQVR